MMTINATPKPNPALIFSGILKQLGALSLLTGIYKLAFPSKKPNMGFNKVPNYGNTASSYFLNSFKLFVGASLINSTFNAFNKASTPANPSKPKGP